MKIYDLSIGVPFTWCEKHFCEKNIIATREDEALSIAAGAWLAGKTPFVYMQNSGLGNCLDVITSLLKPYAIDVDIFIQNRSSPAHHYHMGLITVRIIEMIGYKNAKIRNN